LQFSHLSDHVIRTKVGRRQSEGSKFKNGWQVLGNVKLISKRNGYFEPCCCVN